MVNSSKTKGWADLLNDNHGTPWVRGPSFKTSELMKSQILQKKI